jgi:hypothetical protein
VTGPAEGQQAPFAIPRFYVGDVVQTRRTHPCGSDRWVVDRVGADIGMRCQGCGRRVLLPRYRFERRVRRVLARGPGAPPETPVP